MYVDTLSLEVGSVTLPQMAKLLSVSEAAERLGVHRNRVLAMIKAKNPAKQLRAVMVGNRYVIKESDLEKVRERAPGRPRQTD